MSANQAFHIHISGIVQGVGFRPFVYRIAVDCGISGWVLNSVGGVEIHAQGSDEVLTRFIQRLQEEAPPASSIEKIEWEAVEADGSLTEFTIKKSSAEGQDGVGVITSPDLALCDDCRTELQDPSDRRYHYPFINCTNCGPRFTIIRDLPYDRPKTTMRSFELCDDCRREYEDPLDRRFHAQPNACADCGPELLFWDMDNREGTPLRAQQALDEAVDMLNDGQVVAVKGLGGFHLACDATDDELVASLRKRKGRPAKPFAIMCRDLPTVLRFARVGQRERDELLSPAAPIVVLEELNAGDQSSPRPSQLVAPGQHTVGVMLPYTPLHVLLLEAGPPIMIMTSANPSGLPLVKTNEQALEELSGIADAVLGHNRPVEQRCDDSVLRIVDDRRIVLRRSRGFVPRPIEFEQQFSGLEELQGETLRPAVLALGGDMKNVFCVLGGQQAFLSQHIGNMDYEENHEAFYSALTHMLHLTGLTPVAIAYDPHPAYRVTRWAESEKPEFSAVEHTFAVQHHHAHLASCMLENGLSGDTLGLMLDGTGYGSDGRLWGFELLAGDYASFRRLSHAPYISLPGGESALMHPLRLTVSFTATLLGNDGLERLRAVLDKDDEQGEFDRTHQLLEADLDWPQASSCGRLFDAVSALLGICREVTYEGQAAIELSELAATWHDSDESFSLQRHQSSDSDDELFNLAPLFDAVLSSVEDRFDPARIACCFQNSLADLVVAHTARVAKSEGIDQAVLSGGSFQNPVLFQRVSDRLAQRGLRVYTHDEVPPSDGGVALGQAAVAAALLSGVPSAQKTDIKRSSWGDM